MAVRESLQRRRVSKSGELEAARIPSAHRMGPVRRRRSVPVPVSILR
jgi:hypothetical protein